MFAHVLAVLVGASSFIFYIAAFFYPEVHRPLDWVWSGMGLFYAVVLWFCAGQMTGVVLLGQVTAVALLLILGWQALSIRREKTPAYQQTPVVLTPEVVGEWTKSKINQLRIAPAEVMRPLSPQNRSLNAAAADRFRRVPDPRRRPVYDYEFVEDGLVDSGQTAERLGDRLEEIDEEIGKETGEKSAMPRLAQVAENALVADYSAIGLDADAAADTSLDRGLVPPSVDAEVIAEVIAEVTVEVMPKRLDGDRSELTQQDISAEPVLEAVSSNSLNMDADDWGMDLDAGMDEAIAVSRLPAKEKPSLLRAPIILFGWVKDVVGSIAKPKPSKPVIDIPRRDAAIGTDAAFAAKPPVDNFDDDNSSQFDGDNSSQFDDDNSGDFDDVNNWEESNWDD